MLERTKKRPADDMVTLRLRVHRSNAERIKSLVTSIEAEEQIEARPWREVFHEVRPDEAIPAAVLRGSRVKDGLTQVQLAEMTGIPRRHISEMEHSKRPIGKETAKKLARVLKCDYRVFL
ncbi:MAG: helix-turn-helix transcriptional regulator [Deltaproteobacteria bacterium]|nr:helix-turn-helix transcriptional regulator [Deltaproteobacteria bacterium]